MTVGSWKYGFRSVMAALLVNSRKINIFTSVQRSRYFTKEAVFLCFLFPTGSCGDAENTTPVTSHYVASAKLNTHT